MSEFQNPLINVQPQPWWSARPLPWSARTPEPKNEGSSPRSRERAGARSGRRGRAASQRDAHGRALGELDQEVGLRRRARGQHCGKETSEAGYEPQDVTSRLLHPAEVPSPSEFSSKK